MNVRLNLNRLLFTVVLGPIACTGGPDRPETIALSGDGAFPAKAALASQWTTRPPLVAMWLTDVQVSCEEARDYGFVPYTGSILTAMIFAYGDLETGAYGVYTEDSSLADGGLPYPSPPGFGRISLKVGPSKTLTESSSGALTLARVDDAGLAGELAARWPDGGTLSGVFEASWCQELQELIR